MERQEGRDGRIPGPSQEIGTGGVARRQEERTVHPVQPQRLYTRDARPCEAGEGRPCGGRKCSWMTRIGKRIRQNPQPPRNRRKAGFGAPKWRYVIIRFI